MEQTSMAAPTRLAGAEHQNADEAYHLRNVIAGNEHLLQCGSWAYDVAGEKMQWSDGMFALYGYEKEELAPILSNAWFMLNVIHSEDAMAVENAYRSAVQAGKPGGASQFRARHKQGHWLVCKVNFQIYYGQDGKPEKLVGVTRDVSVDVNHAFTLELFRAQQSERETFLRYGSWEMQLATQEIWWSEGMWQLYDYPPGERPTVNRALYEKHVDADDLAYAQNNFVQELEEKGVYEWIYTITTFTGQKKKLFSSGKYLTDEPGKPLKIMGLTKDVTQQEEYEQSLRLKIDELARSNRELEEFAYVASHDLQEPLRKMTTFAERLQNRYAETLGTDGNLFINRIMGAADNMRRLIDNLLDFSRISRVARNFAPVDLNAVLRKVIHDFETQAEEAEAKIVFAPLPTIDALAVPMDQLFCNLISNALKFRKQGRPTEIHIDATVATQVQKQRHGLPANKLHWCIQVVDNGIGFEPEYAEKIFAMFQRLHGKVEYPGSGMGLSICRKIVDIHHGKIYAQGRPGEGATFSILIPQQQEPA